MLSTETTVLSISGVLRHCGREQTPIFDSLKDPKEYYMLYIQILEILLELQWKIQLRRKAG
jgi:hypothetical protein